MSNIPTLLDKHHGDTKTDPVMTSNRVAGIGISAALGGAAAGALAGTVAGPVGTAVGAAVGAIAAGFAGNAVAASVDADREHAFWRENFNERPYVDAGAHYEDYGPAYGYGLEAYVKHEGLTFDAVEDDLSRDWGKARGTSSLEWERARHASRDAWDRLSNSSDRQAR